MTECDEATASIIERARDIREATQGKSGAALPGDLRRLLARLDGALARLDAAEGRATPHHGGKR